jgi:hypothetical protein
MDTLTLSAFRTLAGGAPILHEGNLRQPRGVARIAAPLPAMRREARQSGFAEWIE